MQQEEGEEERQELEILKCQQPLVRLSLLLTGSIIEGLSLSLFSLSSLSLSLSLFPLQPHHPFEQLLKWEARETAEQLCLIDSALYSKVDRELVRTFSFSSLLSAVPLIVVCYSSHCYFLFPAVVSSSCLFPLVPHSVSLAIS